MKTYPLTGAAPCSIPYSGAVAGPIIQARWRLAGALGVLAVLAACGGPPGAADPKGPFASPTPAPAQLVINRGCANAAHEGPEATDVSFMQSALLRQQSELQRVADDLSGAVPGGNLAADAPLAQANARQLVDLVSRSTLCSPFREQLAAAAKSLLSADDALVGSGDTPGALRTSQAAFQALKAVADHPPTPVTSSPS